MNGSQFNKRFGRASGLFSALILLALTGSALGSATNSAVRATTPVSSYQTGLVNSPNPVDQSGNLAITGNVVGGKHFRGGIPYRSTTSFGAPLGSTSLDPFLRYSAPPEGQTAYSQGYTPFYSPTRTMTTTSPGYSGIFTAASPRIAGGLPLSRVDQPTDTLSAAEIPQFRTSSDELFPRVGSAVSPSPRVPYWPTPASSDETLDGIQETDSPPTTRSSTRVDDPLLTSEEYQRRLQLLLQDLDRARANAAQIEQKLDADGTKTLSQEPTREPSGQLPPRDVMQDAARLPADKPGEVVQDIAAESTGLRLYNPSSRSEGNLFSPPAQAAEIRASVMSPRVDAAGPASLEATLQRISEYTNRLQVASGDRSAAQSVAEPEMSPVEAASPSQMPEPKPPQTNENPDPALRREFDQALATASLNLRQGRFDRAAESFTLACVYLPRDPHAHLGKSHALLALGQYAASEASLAKAVEFDAQVALKKVNLVETIGGPDPFVERITKLEELAQAGDGSLQFLLAYIYYQMDRPNEARLAVETVRRDAISPLAVSQLAAVIGR